MSLAHREKIITLFEKYSNFLTQTQKQTVQLYYYEDLSLAEIAEIVATTRSAVHDALKKGEKKLIHIDEKMNIK